jgi:hypothetical protein
MNEKMAHTTQIQLQQQNTIFLEAIRNTRTNWEHDKELNKIVKKMEKGKNLKKNEFTRIYWALWKKEHKH